jgi:hypothetical protein
MLCRIGLRLPWGFGDADVTIRRLLKDEAAFRPEEAAVLMAAYDDCIGRLKLRDQDDKLTELLARTIIRAARAGERDPSELCQKALQALKAH